MQKTLNKPYVISLFILLYAVLSHRNPLTPTPGFHLMTWLKDLRVVVMLKLDVCFLFVLFQQVIFFICDDFVHDSSPGFQIPFFSNAYLAFD